MAIGAVQLLDGVRETYTRRDRDLEQDVSDLGQVEASRSRELGRPFSKQDHVRGLVLSQLSSQRLWGPIARSMDAISEVFCGFDLDYLRSADPNVLVTGLLEIHCGNRRIAAQMQALKDNIRVFDRIEHDSGTIDSFVEGDSPEKIAQSVALPGRRYKLRQVGLALALEYLKNVGVNAGKPDAHVCRLLGPRRLGYFDNEPLQLDAAREIKRLADEADVTAIYTDNVLWLFCARDYGDICGARPRCDICALASSCAYPANLGVQTDNASHCR
jgi:hypothetical protein